MNSYQKTIVPQGIEIPNQQRRFGRPMAFAVLILFLVVVFCLANPKWSMKVEEDFLRRETLFRVIQELQGLDGTIWMPNNTGFGESASVWTKREALPQLVIQVKSISDVQKAVSVLHQHNVSFRIRSGGHHKSGYSSLPNGVVISTVLLNATDITTHNNETALLKMGPGVTVRQYLNSVFKKTGYAGVLGFCGQVGEGGFLLGGGFGMQSRLYGLGIDSVRSYKIVLYDGTTIIASNHHNSDLFWALRGAGGGSFGVVVEIEYQVYAASDAVIVALLQVQSYADVARILHFIGRQNLPGNFVLMHDQIKGFGLFWTGRNALEVKYGQGFIENLVSRIRPPKDSFNLIYYNISWIHAMGGGESSMTRGWGDSVWGAACWTGFLMPVNNTESVWKDIMGIFEEGFAYSEYLLPDIELWGGAIAKPAPNATAFPYRSAVYNVGVLLMVPEDIDNPERVFQRESAMVNNWWPKVEIYLRGSYVNYPSTYLLQNQPRHYARVQWGGNLPRLVDIKRKYDPENVFHFPMSVPTSLG